jgi:PleD family two-component response regulator
LHRQPWTPFHASGNREGCGPRLSFSLGWEGRKEGGNVEAMLRAADAAMYEAKRRRSELARNEEESGNFSAAPRKGEL